MKPQMNYAMSREFISYLNPLKESHDEDLHQLHLVNPERGRVEKKKLTQIYIYNIYIYS